MSHELRRVGMTRVNYGEPMRRLEFLLLLTAAFVACADPVEPVDRREQPQAPVTSDGHTLLLLPFGDVLTAADGESPIQASGLTFEAGIAGSGVLVDGADRLDYATAGNFGSTAGTVEFWIKPRWNGNDHDPHFFFTI
jgi:hypothetical protein